MRYVKCNNCGADISGDTKYILSLVSESRGEHRNSEQRLLARMCNDCGEEIYRNIGVNGDYLLGGGNTDHLKMIFENDQKKDPIYRKYTDIKITHKKEFFDGKPFVYEDAQLIKSKRYLLTQKITEISNLFKYSFLYYPEYIESLFKVYDVLNFMSDMLMSLDYPTVRYIINPGYTFIDEDTTRSYDNKIDKFIKGIHTIKTHYIDKMQEELKNYEYRGIVVISLVALYKKLGQLMVKEKVMIVDEDSKPDKQNINKAIIKV